mgnify:FL=1
MKVVFDTNIFISGLMWRGAPYRCLLASLAGLVELVVSPPILDELRRTLSTKFGFTDEEVEQVMSAVRESASLVEIRGELKVVADDPEDDKFIETAHVAGAAYVVSGDRHLLSVGSYGEIRIVSARVFLDMLAG